MDRATSAPDRSSIKRIIISALVAPATRCYSLSLSLSLSLSFSPCLSYERRSRSLRVDKTQNARGKRGRESTSAGKDSAFRSSLSGAETPAKLPLRQGVTRGGAANFQEDRGRSPRFALLFRYPRRSTSTRTIRRPASARRSNLAPCSRKASLPRDTRLRQAEAAAKFTAT